MPRRDEARHAEFTRHVRRMERAERMKTAAPFVAIGVVLMGLLAAGSWYNFSSVPCDPVAGAVEDARVERTLGGERHFLMVKGDDEHNYYSEDPQDRAVHRGDRLVLARSCARSGAPRPMAHFDHWLTDAGAT